MSNLSDLTDWGQLKELLEKRKNAQSGTRLDESSLLSALKARIKGQDAILEDLAKLLRLQMAKKQKSRPICNLLFLGPTGTGKTELAKTLAEYLFGNENTMLRFDCSEFSGSEAKTRLIGIPTGYVGADAGGQLTRPVLHNPKRLILFDEIEKAYKEVFDLFLQLMGEARLTEQGSGKTADFSQSIVIFTSNAHSEQIGKIQSEYTDYHEMLNAVKSYLADAKVFRPEILSRIDKVYVFRPLEGLVVAEVALLKITKLASEYGLEVQFVAPELIMKALTANEKISRFGIRELERILFDMFAEPLADLRDQGHQQVRCEIDESGGLFVKPAVG